MKNKNLDKLLKPFWKKQIKIADNLLKNDEVVSIVGLYGIGKSIFIKYLVDHVLNGHIIEVDLKGIKVESNFDIYKLIINELKKKRLISKKIDLPQTDFEFHYLLKEVIKNNLESAQDFKKEIVIIFNESQNLLLLSNSFWHSFESLRHYEKPYLKMIFAGQPGLVNFATQASRRLLRDNYLYIKPFNKIITMALTEKLNITDTEVFSFIWKYSKGHYGTIKYLQRKLNNLKVNNNSLKLVFNKKLFSSLIENDPLLELWIKQIFAELQQEQQFAIFEYLNDNNLNKKFIKTISFNRLVDLGFFSIRKNEKNSQFDVGFLFDEFSDLIEKVVKQKVVLEKKEISISNNKILVNDIDISTLLSNEEQQVLKCLIQSKGEYSSYEQLGDAIWGKNAEKKYSLWALSKLISRLREKLIRIGIPKKTIKTIRSRGYGWYGY